MTELIIPAVDALRDLLPVSGDVVAEDSATEPTKAAPNRLYVWPRRLSTHQLDLAAEEAGREDMTLLRVRILYVLPAKGEPRVQHPDRALTEALAAAAQAIVEAIAANRRHPLWWDAVVEAVVPDAVRTFEVRAYGIDATLRLNDPPPASTTG